MLKPSSHTTNSIFFRYISSDSSSDLNNKNLNFLKQILANKNIIYRPDTQIDCDMILLIKVLEYYLLLKYNKDIAHIIKSNDKMNVSDFIIKNLFLYESIYDETSSVYEKFKEKLNWNFCEILQGVYNLYPKIVKRTIFRHLNYLPLDQSFTYNLIQYYYKNKDFRKTKILIRKLITKEATNESELIKDIVSITILILVNILVNDEKFGEALELAIFNLQRLIESKESNSISEYTKQMINRSYFILGFCYSKVADSTTNYDEKLKNSQLAISLFKQALEVNKENPVFSYYLARQFFEIKLFQQAEETLKILNTESYSKCYHKDHFYGLSILINIANLKYDNALTICDNVLKSCNKKYLKLHIIIILKFYILIYKLINYTSNNLNEEKSLIDNIITFIKLVIEEWEEELRKIELVISTHTEKNLDVNAMIAKDLMKYSTYGTLLDEKVTDEDIRNSKKIYVHEKKNLENLKLEILKNFYSLADMLVKNGYDKGLRIHETLNGILEKTNLHEDINAMIIVNFIKLLF